MTAAVRVLIVLAVVGFALFMGLALHPLWFFALVLLLLLLL